MKIEIKGTKRFAIQTGTYWDMEDDKLIQTIPTIIQGPFAFDIAFLKVGEEFKLNGELKHITVVEYAIFPEKVVFKYEIESGKAPPLPEWLAIFDNPGE